jgi:anti-sigma regulatory factor (Ser/Thr protein kinase)
VAQARHFVAGAVSSTGVDRRVAELLTSELATNAVRHAKTDFEVRIIGQADGVRVEVLNDEPRMVAALREPDEESGRGLSIIDALSSSWGAQAGRFDKVVWFELRRDGEA